MTEPTVTGVPKLSSRYAGDDGVGAAPPDTHQVLVLPSVARDGGKPLWLADADEAGNGVP